MPQAQWVLDAACTADNAQSLQSVPCSPQRLRRGPGVLQLDLRGVPAVLGGGASSQAQASTAQWKPAHSYKPSAAADGHATSAHQPYSALLLSVCTAGNASPILPANGSAGGRVAASTASNAMIVLSPGCARGPVQSPTDPAVPPQLGQRNRPLAARPAAASGLTRMAAGQAPGQTAASSLSSGGAGAATASVSRSIAYNPLLPRQRTPSAGRRRPPTELWPTEQPQHSSSGIAPKPRDRRVTSNGNAAAALQCSSSPVGTEAADSICPPAVATTNLANVAPGPAQSITTAGAAVAPPLPVSLYGCHPAELVTPMAATKEGVAAAATMATAAEVRSPRSPRVNGTDGCAGSRSGSGSGSMLNAASQGVDSATGHASITGLAAGPGLHRNCSGFVDPREGGNSSGWWSSGCARTRADASDLRPSSAQRHRHETICAAPPSQQSSSPLMQVNMHTALAVLGAGVPLPPSPLGGLAGHGRDGGAARPPPPTPPPASVSSASSSGLAPRLSSPVPRRIARSSASGTEDSALEYFGLYEGDALSAEDGASDEEEGEEGEVAEDEDGKERRDEAFPWHVGSARGVRSTANVHAVRRAAAVTAAAAATGQRARPGPPSPQRQQQQRQQQALPWSLQRPPSGRPPPPPHPPGVPVLRRQSSLDVVAAAAAAASIYGSVSAGSKEGSASEAGSRPGTASSAWSGYDLLQPPNLKLRPGRGRSFDNMPAVGDSRDTGADGSSGKANGVDGSNAASSSPGAAAARRRAASNPRDAVALEARNNGGKAPGTTLSRCSSAASHRAAAATERTAVQALALLATLAMASPASPSAASVSSGGGGGTAGRKRAEVSTGRNRKTGGGSGNATPHRALHPAVLALTDLTSLPLDQKRTDRIPTDEKGRPFPYIQPPAFPGTCPTIAFVGSAAEKYQRGLQPLLSPTLYVKYGGVANTPVRTAFKEGGLRPTRKGKRWVVQWGGILDASALAKLHSFQRVNHFPGTWELGHKGHLYRNVYNARRRARSPAAEAFDIVPRFYIMPRDYEEFRADVERFPDRLYIQKPTNSSRGRGIRMVTRPEAISRDAKDVLVQHYISNPLLLNGFKFDMRVYAAATCLDPLRLYVFPDGLARLATEPYSADKADLTKRCVHLTNYSVNKKSNKFIKTQPLLSQPQGQQSGKVAEGGGGDAVPSTSSAPPPALPSFSSSSYNHQPADPSSECDGSKWSLAGLRHYLESKGMGPGWNAVWRQVCDIVAAAVIAAEPRMNTEFKMKVPHRNNCFEVWGFDIMLTDTFRAWLIEANTCPSLAADSRLDMRVKCSMVSELMHLLGPVPYDVEVYEKAAEAKRQARLTGLPVSSTAAARQGASSGGGGGGGGGDDEAPPTPTLGAQQSFGQSVGAGVSSGGIGSGPGSSVVQPKSLHELDAIEFTTLSPAELPDVVLEAEAEMARRGSWQRVFPCEDEPTRYLNLFETPRLNNLLLCKYYAQTSGNGSDLFRRPGSVSRGGPRVGLGGVSGGGGRPMSREWRPGGGG
ncbi:hypothetical protein Vretimale_1604 [Volvox reticuliferus]|uniref:Tubulin--tyrosine ligase-like protein 9 n=1 Tax=Volvox reticuliferus TaxID=1737510 RepID=A0A8J4DBC1_9CHLO|nr:hypothetical protein Vretifemale_15481 [Volvox reticuliferus]GIL95756.1 hypothetical protein Vretimale_1604 [Volvox reticuliferus]